MKADLHMHTTHSDGRLTREEVFKRAKDKGIDVIAITDHDITAEVDDNHKLSEKYGVKYIPGIELSTLYKGKSVHVLGYFKDDSYLSDAMQKYYKTIKKGREDRAKQFIENLNQYFDIHITYDQLLRISGGIIARPHIARAIMENYPKFSHDEIFEKFIGDHQKAYVPSTELSLKEGLDLLKAHNCLRVLAHPVLLKPQIHDAVLAHDFDGIEAIYCLNQPNDTDYYKKIAKEKGLFITAGGDYHGIKNDTKHCDIGEVSLSGEDLEIFLAQFSSPQ